LYSDVVDLTIAPVDDFLSIGIMNSSSDSSFGSSDSISSFSFCYFKNFSLSLIKLSYLYSFGDSS
jgi:hypothetical protein